MTYRIVKITYGDGISSFYVQKKYLKLFWIYCTKVIGYDNYTIKYIKFGTLEDAKKYIWFKETYKTSTAVISKEILPYD